MAEHGPTRAATHSQHRVAMQVAKDAPTQHVPRHVTSHEVRAQMMGTGAMGQFNNHLAVAITKRVGTMWAAYLFVLDRPGIVPAGAASVLTGRHRDGHH